MKSFKADLMDALSLISNIERDLKINTLNANEKLIFYSILLKEKKSKECIISDVIHESKLSAIESYDLCILGMGNDGHIASIFPNMSNLEEALYSKASLLNLYDGYPDVSRVTMSLNEINKSDQIILLIKGEKKFNLLMDKRANNDLLPVDHLFTQMIDKIKVFKII